MIDFSFIEVLGALIFGLILLALLAQLPIIVWAIAIPLFIIIGLIKNK